MFQKLFYLGLAGAAGTIARYWLSGIVQKSIAAEFPFGTAAVNVVGCLLFGLFWAFAENRLSISPHMRMVIFIGFFGAFTTFSSFMFESSQLLHESQWLWASGNIIIQNVLGLICVVAGLAIGKMV